MNYSDGNTGPVVEYEEVDLNDKFYILHNFTRSGVNDRLQVAPQLLYFAT